MAPEVMGILSPADLRLYDVNSSSQHAYSLAVDIWSLGVIGFQLVTNRLPFTEPIALANYVILDAAFPRHVLDSLPDGPPSQDCCRFLEGSMHKSPSKRPTAKELAVLPWLSTIPELPRGSSIFLESGRE